MAQPDLPAIALEALRGLLEEAMARLPGEPVVRVSSPWQGPEHGLFVHLYDIAGRDPAATAEPRWRLRLLIGAFAATDLDVHRLMGHASAALLARPRIEADDMAAAATRLHLPEPAPAGLHARLGAEALSIDDMTRLWRRFAPMRYSLSSGWRLEIA